MSLNFHSHSLVETLSRRVECITIATGRLEGDVQKAWCTVYEPVGYLITKPWALGNSSCIKIRFNHQTVI